MATHVMPAAICPRCGKRELDRATNADGDQEPPRTGDFTVCIRCLQLLVYTDDLRLRSPTQQEVKKAYEMPEIMATMVLVSELKKR